MYRKNIFILFLIILISFLSVKQLHAITVEISASVVGCGDNIINVGEQCDGSNLGGGSCTTIGFSSGVLSCNSICTFNTTMCTTSSGGGGGGGGEGGGGGTKIPDTNVVFSGKAYPNSKITLLKDSQIVGTTFADSKGDFQNTVSGISKGKYTFGVYSEDSNGYKSSLTTFPLSIVKGSVIKVENIFVTPTVVADKIEVKKGDILIISGQSAPFAELLIEINSNPKTLQKVKAGSNGMYSFNFNTSNIEFGKYTLKTKATLTNQSSGFSSTLAFAVGEKNVITETPKKCPTKGDLNSDCKVNLVDFSIAAFWYKKVLSKDFLIIENSKLNSDNKIDLIDFSIMAFHWTG